MKSHLEQQQSHFSRLMAGSKETFILLKIFYFCYFGAVGSLVILLPVYFEQNALGACEIGTLFATRNVVSCISLPFWGHISSFCKTRYKLMLIAVLTCLCLSVVITSQVQPTAIGCLRTNGSHVLVSDVIVNAPETNLHREKANTSSRKKDERLAQYIRRREIGESELITKSPGKDTTGFLRFPIDFLTTASPNFKATGTKEHLSRNKSITAEPKGYSVTDVMLDHVDTQAFYVHPIIYVTSPVTLVKIISNSMDVEYYNVNIERYFTNVKGNNYYAHSLYSTSVTPYWSDVIYLSYSIHSAFILLLIVTVLGEFFGTAALSFADAVTVLNVDDNWAAYEKIRLFGCLGWGSCAFFSAAMIDSFASLRTNQCGDHKPLDRNYSTLFVVVSILLSLAIVVAARSQFRLASRRCSRCKAILHPRNSQIVVATINVEDNSDSLAESYAAFLEGRPCETKHVCSTASGMENGVKGEGWLDGATENIIDNESKEEWWPDGANENTVECGTKPPKTDKNASSAAPTLFFPVGKIGEFDAMKNGLSVLVQMMSTVQKFSSFIIMWYVNFCLGLSSAFIYWHMRSILATPIVFGTLALVTQLAETLVYYSAKLIKVLGK